MKLTKDMVNFLKIDELSKKVIKCVFEVHRNLGPGACRICVVNICFSTSLILRLHF